MTLFEPLLASDAFTQLASDYLSFSASDAVRKEITGFLSKIGRKVLSRRILSNAKPQKEIPGRPVFLVHDAFIVRRFLAKSLYAMELNPQGFGSYGEAMAALSSSSPPDLLICGLMAAGDSCFPFLEEIRKRHCREAFPIILLSTEYEQGVSVFRDASKNGEIAAILSLPFSESSFRNTINTILSLK